MGLHFHFPNCLRRRVLHEGAHRELLLAVRHPRMSPRSSSGSNRHLQGAVEPTLSETETPSTRIPPGDGELPAIIQMITGAVLVAIPHRHGNHHGHGHPRADHRDRGYPPPWGSGRADPLSSHGRRDPASPSWGRFGLGWLGSLAGAIRMWRGTFPSPTSRTSPSDLGHPWRSASRPPSGWAILSTLSRPTASGRAPSVDGFEEPMMALLYVPNPGALMWPA